MNSLRPNYMSKTKMFHSPKGKMQGPKMTLVESLMDRFNKAGDLIVKAGEKFESIIDHNGKFTVSGKNYSLVRGEIGMGWQIAQS